MLKGILLIKIVSNIPEVIVDIEIGPITYLIKIDHQLIVFALNTSLFCHNKSKSKSWYILDYSSTDDGGLFNNLFEYNLLPCLDSDDGKYLNDSQICSNFSTKSISS